jgi:hypothetical protein
MNLIMTYAYDNNNSTQELIVDSRIVCWRKATGNVVELWIGINAMLLEIYEWTVGTDGKCQDGAAKSTGD